MIQRQIQSCMAAVVLGVGVLGGIAVGFDCYTIPSNTCQNLAGGNCYAAAGGAPCYNSTGTCTFLGATWTYQSYRWGAIAHWQCTTSGAASTSKCYSIPDISGQNPLPNACYAIDWWSGVGCGGVTRCRTFGYAGSCTINAGDCARIDP